MKEKTYLDPENQLKQLQERNLAITDFEEGLQILERNNYYNLINGYKSPFLTDYYKDGSCLNEIYSLYRFDKRISKLYFGALMSIENLLKTIIANTFSSKYGHKDYLKLRNFDYVEAQELAALKDTKKIEAMEKNNNIKSLIDKLNKYINNHNYTTRYITHYKNKHKYVPFWVLVNVMTFGDITRLYSLLKQSEKDVVCNKLSQNHRINQKELNNILSMCQDFRNKSAHDQRFYSIQTTNRKGFRFVIQFNNVTYQNKQITHVDTSIFALTIVLKILLDPNDYQQFVNSFIDELTLLSNNIKTVTISYILHEMDFVSNVIQLDTIEKVKDFLESI